LKSSLEQLVRRTLRDSRNSDGPARSLGNIGWLGTQIDRIVAVVKLAKEKIRNIQHPYHALGNIQGLTLCDLSPYKGYQHQCEQRESCE
jgi:hypothetical protein